MCDKSSKLLGSIYKVFWQITLYIDVLPIPDKLSFNDTLNPFRFWVLFLLLIFILFFLSLQGRFYVRGQPDLQQGSRYRFWWISFSFPRRWKGIWLRSYSGSGFDLIFLYIKVIFNLKKIFFSNAAATV